MYDTLFLLKRDFYVLLEEKVLQIMRGEKKSPLLQSLLAVLSQGYRAGIFLRNKGYDHHLLPSFRLTKTVISIGNVATCGTGKTPFTHLLASLLSSQVELAILTRGFKSAIERSGDNQQIPCLSMASAEKYGDEPLLLARKTKLPVWVGADRVKSGNLAIQAGANCLLLDDGMQHRRLHRDIEIVLVDGKDPLSKNRFLPYGFLRDSLSRFKTATVVVATHIQDKTHYNRVKTLLAPFSSAPLIGVRTQVLNPPLPPAKVGVFCGIGQPERFLQTVRDLNQEIVDTLICKDHEIPQVGQLELFARQCLAKGAKALLCTEKDAVKLSLPLSLDLPIIPIEIGLEIVEGESHLQQLIETIVKKVKS